MVAAAIMPGMSLTCSLEVGGEAEKQDQGHGAPSQSEWGVSGSQWGVLYFSFCDSHLKPYWKSLQRCKNMVSTTHVQ